ncbi:MAG: Mu transposase C-terminal domain-containing protein [Acetatifactor muris]|nr:Mu transposase C-terminal domain-containing protein [Acetatifactor muris]
MEYLSVPEYARLRGCSERYVRMLIAKGIIHTVEKNGKLGGGISGVSYFIPLASIEPKLIRKYQRQQEKKNGVQEPKPRKKLLVLSAEDMTAEERQQVARWKLILKEWQAYRGQGGKKADRDKEFVAYISTQYPEMKFSVRILQRHGQALLEQGEAALIDGRGRHENHKKGIPDEVFAVFMSYYLDESRKSVQKCISMTETWIRHEGKTEFLPLASRQTFTREILRSIPPAAVVLCREGIKACTDKMLPYIKRIYEDLYSNDIWVCDNHTFDVFVNDGEHEKPVRVYLTAFQDVRSRKFVGWYVTLNPSSSATLIALRRGIEEYGIPKRILSDNGREFLTFDIGGRGFRKSRKPSREEHEIPTILDNLGIEFRTAMVKNARAKIIERAFLDVKNEFSKMFEGYTGGTIAERPERLKKTGRDADNFILLPEFVEYVDKYIRGIFNKHKHGGMGMNNRTPDQVYAACLVEQRAATPEQLNLMMLRNTRMQKVGRDGVHLDLYGQKVFFNSNDLNFYHIGRKVYFRYDPDHLEEVRVYDDRDRFLCTAQQTGTLSYFADKEAVKEAVQENRKYMKAVKTWKEQHVKQAHDELELLMWQAEQNMAEDRIRPNPKIVRIVTADEETERGLARAAGGAGETIDYTAALERLKQAKEE